MAFEHRHELAARQLGSGELLEHVREPVALPRRGQGAAHFVDGEATLDIRALRAGRQRRKRYISAMSGFR